MEEKKPKKKKQTKEAPINLKLLIEEEKNKPSTPQSKIHFVFNTF